MKGFTITVKMEVNLEGLPPEMVEKIQGSGVIAEIVQGLREELEDDMMVPAELRERVKTSVEVEEHE